MGILVRLYLFFEALLHHLLLLLYFLCLLLLLNHLCEHVLQLRVHFVEDRISFLFNFIISQFTKIMFAAHVDEGPLDIADKGMLSFFLLDKVLRLAYFVDFNSVSIGFRVLELLHILAGEECIQDNLFDECIV